MTKRKKEYSLPNNNPIPSWPSLYGGLHFFDTTNMNIKGKEKVSIQKKGVCKRRIVLQV